MTLTSSFVIITLLFWFGCIICGCIYGVKAYKRRLLANEGNLPYYASTQKPEKEFPYLPKDKFFETKAVAERLREAGLEILVKGVSI